VNRSASQDAVVALFLAAFGVFVLVDMGMARGANIVGAGGVTFATLPMLYAGLLLLLSALMLVGAIVRLRREPDGKIAFVLAPVVWVRIGSTIGLCLLFALLLNRVPFMLLTAVFLFLLFLAYGHRKFQSALVVAVVGAIGLDALFLRILHLPL
jgi:Tripartite tricarboxylate transporter TctB family